MDLLLVFVLINDQKRLGFAVELQHADDNGKFGLTIVFTQPPAV